MVARIRSTTFALGLAFVIGASCSTPSARVAQTVTRHRAAREAPRERDVTLEPSSSPFAGIWSTTFGALRLDAEPDDADALAGSYSYSGRSTIAGRAEERRFEFTYREPDGTEGRGVFELADDGASFIGRWRPGLDASTPLGDADGAWEGRRVESVPDRTWLVVLEAHWEGSLVETEYSYGAMLRSFFTRLPNVAVRHRFFHDEDDVRRYCAELEYLPEPVVLYVSSHGGGDGISSGGGTIGPRVFAEALANARNVELLHLGACSVMSGSFAQSVHDALPEGVRFPISGFKRDADWAGSALVDLAYMDFVLERGLAPKDAVDAVRSTISFAGDGESDAVAPMDLAIDE